MPRFEKGKSGNPTGKKKGTKNKSTHEREALMNRTFPEERVVGMLEALYLKGIRDQDAACIKVVLEYLWGKPHQSGDLTVRPDVDGIQVLRDMFGFRSPESDH